MSDFPRHWLPKSTRNRFALTLAVCSLLLLITWNLMPNYERSFAHRPSSVEKNGIIATEIWPGILGGLLYILHDEVDMGNILRLIATFSLILLVMVNLLLVPFWSVAAKSKELRYIPAVICLLGFAAMFFLAMMDLHDDFDDYDRYNYIVLSLIGLNFLLMALSLLLFGQEPAETIEPHESFP
jgi:hypothetical protein